MKIIELIEGAGDAFNRALSGSPAKSPINKNNSFIQNVKKGYTGTRKAIKDLPYSNLGRAARGASQYFQKVNKGHTIK